MNAAKACADKAEQIKSEIDLAQSELSNAKSDFDSKLSAENETAKQLKSFESELENKKRSLILFFQRIISWNVPILIC